MITICSLLVAMAGEPATPDGLVVHEWGTFTCFVGRQSKSTPIQIDVGADLPSFVLTRPSFAGQPTDHTILKSGKGSISARQRMETPVLYFYSDKPTSVDVRVAFPQGLITEFFPRPSAIGPEYRGLDDEKCGDASIEWKNVHVLASQSGGEPPSITEKTHYAAARDTDASLIAVKDSAGAETFEKFLFYRGMAGFESPLTLRQERGVIAAVSEQGVPAYAVLVNVRDGVVRAQSTRPEAKEFTLALGAEHASVDELANEFAAALVRDGLFEREAVSMVSTWRDLWFGEPGTRVLYILPEGEPDRLLPLSITPAPAAIDRVFVGRIELLTDEDLAWFDGAKSRVIGAGASADEIRAKLYPEAQPRFGRFAWPAMDALTKR